MGKLKKCICLLIAVVFLAAVIPTVALAADDPIPIYVSEEGNDTEGDGTQGNPYATLEKAAEEINKTKNQDYTIYIMSDLTMTVSARFWDNNVSIQSDLAELAESGKTAFTLSRAATGFRAEQDPARGGYNPALIEIGGEGGKGGDLTLSNIILDDGHHAAYSYTGSNQHASAANPYFVQVDASRSGNPTGQPQPGSTTVSGTEVDNHEIVQDAMIASYDSNSTITLGAGTTLQNYGGMSAVRVTGSSKLVMEPESKICDEDTVTRSKGAADSYGPAGAVWIQSGNFEMKDGAEISNLNGRAIYADGGTVTVNGSINNITGNANMWQGQDGVAVHVRGGAKVTLESNSIIDNVTKQLPKAASAVFVTNNSSLEMKQHAKICNLNGTAISGRGNNDETPDDIKIIIDGEICGIKAGGNNAINLNQSDGLYCLIDKNAKIYDNKVENGTIYLQGTENMKLDLYGEISNNVSSRATAGIWLANNFSGKSVTMYDGAKITGNISTQAGGEFVGSVIVTCGTFKMVGGEISDNYAAYIGTNSESYSKYLSAGVAVWRGGHFEMDGGTIKDNKSMGIGGGVLYRAEEWGNQLSKIDLNDGEISNNLMQMTVSSDGNGGFDFDGGKSNDISLDNVSLTNNDYHSHINRYVSINDDVTIGNSRIYMYKYDFTFERPGKSVKFGNAAAACEDAVTDALDSQHLTEVVGSIWYQTNKGNLPLTVYDLTQNGKYNESKDLYAAVVDTNEKGTVDGGKKVALYTVDVKANGSFDLNLPGGAANGTAVVFLQEGNTPANIITLKPVDLTAYMGGDQGYDAVFDTNSPNNQVSTSLPHPLFTVTGVEDAEGMDFSEAGTGKKWTLVKDGTGYYHFKEGADQEKVRVTYTNDKTGATTLNDSFNLKDVHDTFNTYTVALYTGAVDMSKVKASLGEQEYAVALGTGTLTVRAVEDKDPTSDIQSIAPTEPVGPGTAVAVAPTGTTYTLNNTGVPLPEIASDTNPNGSKPSLLFDSIIEDDAESTARTDALTDRVDKKLGAVGSNTTRHYEVKYLDLVDANNGNAWITSSKGMDIYWGYPEGTGIETEFHVLHFEDLHRDGTQSGFEISDIQNAQVTELTEETDQLQNTEYGIKFHVEPGNFSPYVLVWEKTSTSHNPGTTPTPDPTPTPEPEEPDQPELERDDHYAYIFGYEDNTIRPENDITRAEVATIFYRLLTDESREAYRTTDHDFTDVSADAWYAEPVATLAGAGLLAGYEDGSFRPDAPITRAEYAAIATRFDELAAAESNFTDISGHWAEDAINAAYGAGWVGGYEDGTFRPDQNISRAEAMALINRVLERAVDSDGMLDEMTHWADNDPEAWYYADIQEATHSHTYEREEGEQYETWTALVPHKVF
ncbi:MAG: S-layer homology domain-containing protein [Peptococcaceae bacterium]|nr:S-layer homology domain-containing protein [Peptococcaceae bacterium]